MKKSLRLRGISNCVKGKVWESQTRFRVGRSGSSEVIVDENSVSRAHADFRTTHDGRWCVSDIDSTNGTYLNGVPIGKSNRVDPSCQSPACGRDRPAILALQDGDIIQFGKVAMKVEIGAAPDTATIVNADELAFKRLGDRLSSMRGTFDMGR